MLLIDVMPQVGELSVAVGAWLGLAGTLLLWRYLGADKDCVVVHVVVVVIVVVHQTLVEHNL